MSVHLLSIVLLVLIFVLGVTRSVNLGVLGFGVAFALGVGAAGLDVDGVLAGFPVGLVVTLIGVTLLFGFARSAGTVDLLISWTLRLLGGRVGAVPWIFFALTALLMGMGNLLATAVVAPLAMDFARRHDLNRLMAGMMVVHGSLAGTFSPINPFGILVNATLAREGLPQNPVAVALVPFVVNTALALMLYLVFRGYRGGAVPDRAAADPGASGAAEPGGSVAQTLTVRPATARLTGFQSLTLASLVVLVVGTLVFDADIAVLSLTMSAVLAVLRPAEAKASLAGISWSTVVLIAGVITYIAMLQEIGTVGFVSDGIALVGSPLLAALLICYVSGLVSAFASSLGTITVSIALVTPLLVGGDLPAVAVAIAVAVSATVVDVSPFSTNGALVLASTPEVDRERTYRQMLGYSAAVVTLGPFCAWLVVLVGS